MISSYAVSRGLSGHSLRVARKIGCSLKLRLTGVRGSGMRCGRNQFGKRLSPLEPDTGRIYRLDTSFISSDVYRFLDLTKTARSAGASGLDTLEQAYGLYVSSRPPQRVCRRYECRCSPSRPRYAAGQAVVSMCQPDRNSIRSPTHQLVQRLTTG